MKCLNSGFGFFLDFEGNEFGLCSKVLRESYDYEVSEEVQDLLNIYTNWIELNGIIYFFDMRHF